jgi:nondiscriminating glutamyl-tRNA synthetase
LNQTHLKALRRIRTLELANPFLRQSGIRAEEENERWLGAALDAVWEEVDTLSQLADRLRIFFDEDWSLEPEAERILAQEENRRVVRGLEEELRGVEEITPENYRRILSGLGKKVGVSGRELYMPLRAALTGRTRGPELDKVFILLGKEKVLRRAESALQGTG